MIGQSKNCRWSHLHVMIGQSKNCRWSHLHVMIGQSKIIVYCLVTCYDWSIKMKEKEGKIKWAFPGK